MTRKYTKHSSDLKKQVVDEYLQNKKHTSYRLIGEKYGISPKTVSTWVFQQKHNTGEKQRGNFKETNIVYKERYEILKKFLDSQQ